MPADLPRFDLGPDLPALRAAASRRVDDAAEVARLQFLTPGAGQAAEYLAGEAEARDLLALADGVAPDPADYPFLVAEQLAQASVLGAPPPLAAIAAEVNAQAEAWRVVGSAIKALRRGAKLRIEAATTPAEVEAATVIGWPSP